LPLLFQLRLVDSRNPDCLLLWNSLERSDV
jgi:hypothetical protein